MLVSDLCRKHLVTIEKGASLQEAARSMQRNRIGALVVVENNQSCQALGLVTDRDLAVRGFGSGLPFSTEVQKILGPVLLTVNETEDASCVIQKMVQAGVRRLIVTNAFGGAIGIVSFDDLFQRLAKEIGGLSDIIKNQIEEPLDQAYWESVVL